MIRQPDLTFPDHFGPWVSLLSVGIAALVAAAGRELSEGGDGGAQVTAGGNTLTKSLDYSEIFGFVIRVETESSRTVNPFNINYN